MKKARRILNAFILTIVGLYAALVIVVSLPPVQTALGSGLASVLEDRVGAKVSVGKIRVWLPNRIVIDNVLMDDQQGNPLLRAARLSAKISLTSLLHGQVRIESMQMFSPEINLYRANADAPLNCQFVIDSLSSKDSEKKGTLDLAVNSLVMRHGKLKYNRLDAPRTSTFNANHLNVSGLSLHVMLNALTNDSLNVNAKRISLKEASGLELKSLSFQIAANKKHLLLQHFKLRLPNSEIDLPKVSASYAFGDKGLIRNSLRYEATLRQSHIDTDDIRFLSSRLDGIGRRVIASCDVKGQGNLLVVRHLIAAIPHDRRARSFRVAMDAWIEGSGAASFGNGLRKWSANIKSFSLDGEALTFLTGGKPSPLERMGSVKFRGSGHGGGDEAAIIGTLITESGTADVDVKAMGKRLSGHVRTDGINVGRLLDDSRIGVVAADMNLSVDAEHKFYAAKGRSTRLEILGVTLSGIDIDAQARNTAISGELTINDPNAKLKLSGNSNIGKGCQSADFKAVIDHLNLAALGYKGGGRLAKATYKAMIDANVSVNHGLSSICGEVRLSDLYIQSQDIDYHLDSLSLQASDRNGGRLLTLNSDFAQATLKGRFDNESLAQSVENIILERLPSLEQITALRRRPTGVNDFELSASVSKTDWLRMLTGWDVELNQPLALNLVMTGSQETLTMDAATEALTIRGSQLDGVKLMVDSRGDGIVATLNFRQQLGGDKRHDWNLNLVADDDVLTSTLGLDNHDAHQRLKGSLTSKMRFEKGDDGLTTAHFDIVPSRFMVGDTLMEVKAEDITYRKQSLQVENLTLTSGNQSIRVDGSAKKGTDDSLTVDLKNVDVAYVLDLVNFHSVRFDGNVSGTARLSRLFDTPQVRSNLRVDDFKLFDGRLGTLYANVAWDQHKGLVDIDGHAVDSLEQDNSHQRITGVKGYVSLAEHNIDLDISLDNSRAEFLQTLCSSFLGRVDAAGNGDLRLWGDLSAINLTGDISVSGSVAVLPLGVTYGLDNAKVSFLEDAIRFDNDTVTDRYGQHGIISGEINHRHLGKMAYNLQIGVPRRLLVFDEDGSDGSTFYGTVYAAGSAHIKGQSGEVVIDVDATTADGSMVVYDNTSPDAADEKQYIHWASASDSASVTASALLNREVADINIPTDIILNFNLDVRPNATLKLIMDAQSGDYLTLNGAGSLKASYYNKGGISIFGNYIVDHGQYGLTIQNIIRRNFEFLQGGTIAFGGDPYRASLNLKAQYSLPSVSLAGLELGRSFSSNNVRVNCIMDITGTPQEPKVDFSLDMPSLGDDAKQMVYSVFNSEEEMNQQALYLLAVGRFYSQSRNNAADNASQSQTTLAMQSMLSGQISQQLNNILGSVMNTGKWNFGANISTGNEGWSNAEYEGLLNGSLLNNRLLINGQFGYRDNANATTSFIGDFDVRYLILPNGNVSVRVYNQSNDRYFTRNSLNTQGVGFIIKKDFNGFRDLFGLKRRRSALRR